MLYEKKSLIRERFSKKNTAIAALVIALIIELSYIYFPKEFWGPIKLIDVINAVAQFATAGAFYLGFHQYRKNKVSERQVVLINECKALIVKMQNCIGQIKVGEETSTSNLSSNMNQLSNIATDFNAIFETLTEDIHKAIVRMHWQGMYFNSFSPTMLQLDFGRILCECGVPPATYIRGLASAKKEINEERVQLFPQYVLMKKIMGTDYIKDLFKPKGRIQSPFLFELYFFDNEGLKDHLYGCVNIIDIRAIAPVLAVIFEQLRFLDEFN